MRDFEEIILGALYEIKTLEIDTEKKVFKINGIDLGNYCNYFEISCAGGEGFKICMVLQKCIVCANYGLDNALKEPLAVLIKK